MKLTNNQNKQHQSTQRTTKPKPCLMMNFIVFTALLTTVIYAETPRTFAGTKEQGAVCRQPGDCLEPYYCLKLEGADGFTCERKTCRGRDQCRIGQFCDLSSNKCDVVRCNRDDKCPGKTICYVDGKCSPRASYGQKCARDAQCWGSCVDGTCTRDPTSSAGAASNNTTPVTEDTPQVSNSPDDDDEDDSSISGGAIAGIVVGSLALLALLCVLCWGLGRKNEKKEQGSTSSAEQA